MFFSTNNVNGSTSDTSLASLMNINVANAQGGESPTTPPTTKYIRYVSAAYPCMNSYGETTHWGVACGSFETENPQLGQSSCTEVHC